MFNLLSYVQFVQLYSICSVLFSYVQFRSVMFNWLTFEQLCSVLFSYVQFRSVMFNWLTFVQLCSVLLSYVQFVQFQCLYIFSSVPQIQKEIKALFVRNLTLQDECLYC